MAANLNTSSIVDFLSSIGQSSDYNTRANLARQYGISGYTGTAAQNTQLLNAVRSNYTSSQQQQAPQQTYNQPTQTQQQPTYSNTPSVVPTPQQNQPAASTYQPPVGAVNINDLQVQLRQQIQQGYIDPKDAWAQLDRMIIGQLTGWSGVMTAKQREAYDQMAPVRKQALYANLGTIKTTDGNIGTVNPGTGDVMRSSTKQTTSNTSIGGGGNTTTGAKIYDSYTGKLITGPYSVDSTTGAVTAGGTVAPTGSKPLYDAATGKPMQNGYAVTVNGQTYYAATQEDADRINSTIAPALQGLVNSGLQISPDVNIDDATIAAILEKAKTLVHPQFAQQIAGVVDDLKRTAGLYAEEYNNQIAGQTDEFTENLANAREQNAQSGTVFSGARGYQENRMKNAQDRTLASLGTNFGMKIGDIGREAEKALGTEGLNNSGYQLPTLQRYTSSTEGFGGLNGSGNVNTGFTPGIYRLGIIPQAETAAALALRNQNVNEASRRKTQGLSYTDLYQ